MNNQVAIPFIHREIDKVEINQRILDGYINATAVCKAANKKFNDYARLSTTQEYLTELSSDTGIPVSTLIQQVKGGLPENQGTWVHPQVAISLGQWASPKFAVAVSKWVFEWLNGNVPNKSKLPYHIQRYLINRSEIPHTHFSVFNEIVFSLVAPLEDKGYELPDKLVPDISQGKMFANWVRTEMKLEPNDFPTYTHTYPDGRVIPGAKLYPNKLLPAFREHFHNVWLKERAAKYFKERDKNALEYLRQVLQELPAPKNELALNSEINYEIDKEREKENLDNSLSTFNKNLRGILSVPTPRREDYDDE